MSTTGDVQITIVDNGGSSNINVAAPTVVAVAGVSSAGTSLAPLSTKSIQTITSTFGYGPLSELCALLISAGATVIATRLPITSTGTATSVTHTGTGTSAMTVTVDGTIGAFDTYYIKLSVLNSGAIGTDDMKFTISLDAGRTTGPQLILVSPASNYVIPNTGLTLTFGSGSFVAGDTFTFSTTEPASTSANVATWVSSTLFSSPYALSGWGNMIAHHKTSNTGAATIESALDANATQQLYDRMFVHATDATTPVAWGGAGETDAAWSSALISGWTAVSTRRLAVAAGFYNTQSSLTNAAIGTPIMRRPLSWSIMQRKVQVATQVLSSRVKDGPLASIVVDPTSDPLDGFVYHDERLNPGLDAARFASAWTRLQQTQGFFVRSENLMSPVGSDFSLYALGQCFDNFCATLVQYLTAQIDTSVRTNKNGTIYENDAQTLEKGCLSALANAMPGQYQAPNTSVVIDRAYNVQANSRVKINGYFGALGYIREFDLTVQFTNTLAA